MGAWVRGWGGWPGVGGLGWAVPRSELIGFELAGVAGAGLAQSQATKPPPWVSLGGSSCCHHWVGSSATWGVVGCVAGGVALIQAGLWRCRQPS